MELTITFGWWLLPLIITIASFWWTIVEINKSGRSGYGYGDIGGLFSLLVSIIVSLIAWLI